MHSKVFSATTIGVNAHLIEVEADVSLGLINFYLVGLPDTAIKESSKRVITALKNSGIRLPAKKITVNLAPADIKKEGTLFDLPIALGILIADGQVEIPQTFLQETVFLGELSLDGSIRAIKGALAIASDITKLNKKRLILPQANAHEAALIEDLEIIGVEHITQLIGYLRGEILLHPIKSTFGKEQATQATALDFSQVKGQQLAKRALQIAASGRHNILFIGPPGSGKTMLAQRLPSIMPNMTFHEVLETTKIYSIAGKLGTDPLIMQRPFRAPHHTISAPGLVGGGSFPQPGEISLSHHGILFLDELTEFKRHTLEVLRQPLEHKMVHIARAHHAITFPASFLLVAALNPCPCGYFGDRKRMCHCPAPAINKYLSKLSGPLLDRIDLQINVQSIEYDMIKSSDKKEQSSADLLVGVHHALYAQEQRFGTNKRFNNSLSSTEIEEFCTLNSEAELLVKKTFEALRLSMRGYHKLLKIARTIADIENSASIEIPHIKEAIMYRSLDRTIEQNRL